MRSETAMLASLGIDPDAFEKYSQGCASTFSFPSVAAGLPDNLIHCQLHGNHKRHKAIYGGIPYEWDDSEGINGRDR